MKDETYPEKLLEDYETVLGAYPQHFKLREKVAEILNSHFKSFKDCKIIDIGCGTGETTECILRQSSNIKIIAIDLDKRMVEKLQSNLHKYVQNGRLFPVCQDIFTYIKKLDSTSLDGVTSSWAIHNFTRAKRKELLKQVYRVLKPNGIFVNMDKYVSDDAKIEKMSFDKAVENLKSSLNKEVAASAIKHEEEDRHPKIIMKEKESAAEMEKIGFRNINFHIRIGRETVMSCLK